MIHKIIYILILFLSHSIEGTKININIINEFKLNTSKDNWQISRSLE